MTGKSMKRMLGRCLVGLGMAFSGTLVSFSSAHSETLNISSFVELDKYFADRDYEVENGLTAARKFHRLSFWIFPIAGVKKLPPP